MKGSTMKLLKKRVRLSVIALAALPLASCQTLFARTECVIFSPINASSKDTVSTQNQVARENKKGITLCGWKA
jgi:hypothetical protein